MQQSFDMLTEQNNFDQRLIPFAEYFQTTWLGTIGRPAMFPRELWNVYERTLADEPRTNNNLGKFDYPNNWKPRIFPNFCWQSMLVRLTLLDAVYLVLITRILIIFCRRLALGLPEPTEKLQQEHLQTD